MSGSKYTSKGNVQKNVQINLFCNEDSSIIDANDMSKKEKGSTHLSSSTANNDINCVKPLSPPVFLNGAMRKI